MKTKTKLFSIFIVLFASFAGSLLVPSHVEAQPACTLETGQFRNYDYGLGFPSGWFSDSVGQTSGQPYIYLDLKFSPPCVDSGDLISVQIHEHDSLDPNDAFLYVPNFSITTADELQKTLVFKAGDVWCDAGDSGDCDYFLFMTIQGQAYNFSPGAGGVGTQSHPLNVEYDCAGPCDNNEWGYLFVVNGTYGQYFAPEDPDLVMEEGVSEGSDTPGGTNGSDTPDGSEGSDYGPNTPAITETISNPLGDGSTLPAFVNSLIGIFVRFMIPIIVLAYIYTGFRYVLARGNPEKLRDAHKLFLTVVIGSAIVLGAWTIATIITTTVNAIL